METNENYNDSNHGTRIVGRGKWSLEYPVVHFPCEQCRRGEHHRCTEEIARKNGNISGKGAECFCLWNDHEEDQGE